VNRYVQDIIDEFGFHIEAGFVLDKNMGLDLLRAVGVAKPIDKFVVLRAADAGCQAVAGARDMTPEAVKHRH
jgi:hypothetical protein